ncbi:MULTISPECIES: MmoB/DmpM family protein [unclassified Caballeronia]|uniref:MmoB/DmpM family protein n=1 Tax=unclassified Caballeronia TaxID=2646786 RepID=UPI001F2AB8C8|nr:MULTISPECIES: MmoB/DmpM family protein [unclassified Caballeronia]MCE4547306.1 MmoB/DmpM family protein [Caballeronia sp. PC1]MCE4575289.1 MmoB/DmpM family protein [Caballeronia sp. CLC5]MDR5749042.1 MmoB/DmpM family protein [Caballeronia sp. LZ029]
MSDHHNADFVGPIIGLGEIADAAAEAVYIDNPGREVRIEKNSGYVRVEARGECTLTVQTMSEVLGRDFRLGDLERSMPGFAGFIRTSDDAISFLAHSRKKGQ